MLTNIISNNQIAPGIYDLRLDFDKDSTPGRFLHIAVPGDGRILRRPLSLCAPNRVVYAVKGEGTKWLSAQTGRLDILGPLGKGFPLSDEPTLLIGGGLGVPPMLYCHKVLKNSHALLGFRDEQSVILADVFNSKEIFLGENYPHERIKELNYKRIFACGPKAMLRAVSKECAKLDIECYVSLEERMACGIGACLVCSCSINKEYKRVCKDGPVFNALEVDWDE